MKTTTDATLLIGGIIAAFAGFALAQDGSNAWYFLGVVGLISAIVGAVKTWGRSRDNG